MKIRHELFCERVINAEVVNVPMAVSYCDEYENSLPVLAIYTDRKNDVYRKEDAYEVTEIPCQGEFRGRGFRLRKTVHAKNGQYQLVEQAEPYDVFIDENEQRHTCDCPGGTYKHYCKHMDALRYLVREKTLDVAEETPHMSNEHVPEYEEPALVGVLSESALASNEPENTDGIPF